MDKMMIRDYRNYFKEIEIISSVKTRVMISNSISLTNKIDNAKS